MNKILTVKNLEKTYKTDIETLTVLKNLNFEAVEGSKTAIVGESGSGKSTLLNIIGSIDTATGGTVQVESYVSFRARKIRIPFVVFGAGVPVSLSAQGFHRA